MLDAVSSSARIGLADSAPTCSIHAGIPCPRPATNLPGYRRARVAISIAAATGFRNTTGITPSLRRLLLSWRVPVHAETRPGGFIVAPVSLSADERGLAWMLDAVQLFGEKAAKLRT